MEIEEFSKVATVRNNERVAEEIIREKLKEAELYTPQCEQVRISSGKRPEFVIKNYNDSLVVVIECKRSVDLHNNAVNQLSDYMQTLATSRNVIGIAVPADAAGARINSR